MKNFGEFFLDQVKSASTVIFSRTQLLSPDRVEKSRQLIAEAHPDARIITTPWDDMEPDFILEVIENGKPIWFAPLEDDDDDEEDEHEHHHHHDHDDDDHVHEHHHHHEHDDDDNDHEHEHEHHHHHHHHGEGEHDADEVFGNIGLETAQRYEKDEIRDILSKLSDEEEYGRILRAKGILQNAAGEWFQFDYVPGEIDLRDGSADYTGRLCVIGADLNEKALTELFHL
jgi:G3E family GTPase